MQAIYKWLPKDDSNIRKCFESKGSEGLKNALFKVRDNTDDGTWIPPSVLEELRTEWDGPAWKEISRKNSSNRQSKEGLNLHSGGSISAREHGKRLVSHFNLIL